MKKKTLCMAIVLALSSLRDGQAEEAAVDDKAIIKVTGHYDNAVGTSDAASQGTITADLIASRTHLRAADEWQGGFAPECFAVEPSRRGRVGGCGRDR